MVFDWFGSAGRGVVAAGAARMIPNPFKPICFDTESFGCIALDVPPPTAAELASGGVVRAIILTDAGLECREVPYGDLFDRA